ncbi:MAG: hypothetical protein RLZZ453_551 [Chlamydiota bacterium]|jgi:hypothetical protein
MTPLSSNRVPHSTYSGYLTPPPLARSISPNSPQSPAPYWTHLELGAGNYGTDGYTQASLQKTVGQVIPNFCTSSEYLSQQKTSTGNYNREQYSLLFITLEMLVERYGQEGIFHVNDICPEYAAFATEKLQEHAMSKRYSCIIIESIPGDYKLLDPTVTLAKYNMTRYSTVHLKNPEVSFYHDKMDGNSYLSSDASCANARSLLQRLANLSHSGLYFFVPYTKEIFPEQERQKVQKKEFYHLTAEWPPLCYIFPEGTRLPSKGRVLFICRNAY